MRRSRRPRPDRCGSLPCPSSGLNVGIRPAAAAGDAPRSGSDPDSSEDRSRPASTALSRVAAVLACVRDGRPVFRALRMVPASRQPREVGKVARRFAAMPVRACVARGDAGPRPTARRTPTERTVPPIRRPEHAERSGGKWIERRSAAMGSGVNRIALACRATQRAITSGEGAHAGGRGRAHGLELARHAAHYIYIATRRAAGSGLRCEAPR